MLGGYALFWAWSAASAVRGPGAGHRPVRKLAGTLCWNEASQRLPTALVGPLIVFDSLAALGYALLLRGTLLPPLTGLGLALLVAGVVWALRIKPEPLPEAAAQAH